MDHKHTGFTWVCQPSVRYGLCPRRQCLAVGLAFEQQYIEDGDVRRSNGLCGPRTNRFRLFAPAFALCRSSRVLFDIVRDCLCADYGPGVLNCACDRAGIRGSD